MYVIIIIKGHSLRRACLQPATNTDDLQYSTDDLQYSTDDLQYSTVRRPTVQYRRPAVSLVIHRSQLLWRVSSLDCWVLDKAHDSAAPCRRTDKPWLNKHYFFTLNETFLEVITMLLSLPKVIAANPMRLFYSLSWLTSF